MCGSTYRSQPCLAYHVKQKKHSFIWSDYDALAELYITTNDDGKRRGGGGKKKVSHQAIQTDIEKKSKKRGGVSQTTQTATRSTTKKKRTIASTSIETVEVATSTQTLPVDFSFLNDPLLLIDSASQTMPTFEPDLQVCNIETQTERDVFLGCDTQNTDSIELMLCNNMQTQTNHEWFSTGLNDIETQTHWDTEFDYSGYNVSTETQTQYPSSLIFNSNSSSYTQTSRCVEFIDRLTQT